MGLSVASTLLFLLSFLPLGKRLIQYRRLLFALALACLMTYLASLISVFLDPSWIDNGVQETIVFPYHFGWALFTAPMFQLIIIPFVIVGMKIIYRRK